MQLVVCVKTSWRCEYGKFEKERKANSLPMAVAIESPKWRVDRHAGILGTAHLANAILEPVGTREFVGSKAT